MLVSHIQRIWFQDLERFLRFYFSSRFYSDLAILECSQWFAPLCKPSLFTFMKASLDHSLWQPFPEDSQYVSMLRRVYPHQGQDSVILHLLLLVLQAFWCCWVRQFYISLDFILIAQVKQLPNDSSTPEVNSSPFICFICLEERRERTRRAMKLLLSLLSQYFCAPENEGITSVARTHRE